MNFEKVFTVQVAVCIICLLCSAFNIIVQMETKISLGQNHVKARPKKFSGSTQTRKLC